MKAIRVHETGGPEAMKLEEVDTPTPGKGQALVRVRAAGVNFIDVYHRTGRYPSPAPITLGMEGAGEVEAVGEGVTQVAAGDRVAWASVRGSYATQVVAPADRLVPLPDDVSFTDGAAAMLQGMTAHYLTLSTFELQSGQTCLVHAAAGGVGLLLCQLGRRRGARVIGTTSTPDKAERAKEAGAADVILYTEKEFKDEVARLTGGDGVHVVYDSVGKSTFEKSLRCLRPRGMMVLFGQSSGSVAALDPQILNRLGSLYLTRPSLFDYVASRAELLARAGDVLGWVADGELSLRIHDEIPLAEASRAHRMLEERRTSGKVILKP